jgi:hypothetical protein
MRPTRATVDFPPLPSHSELRQSSECDADLARDIDDAWTDSTNPSTTTREGRGLSKFECENRMMKRMRIGMGIAVALIFPAIICGGVHMARQVYLGPWLEVKTLDQFALLYGSAGRYLDEENPMADPPEIERAMRAAYTERTGLAEPADGWGRPISMEVAVEGDRCVLNFHSDGLDGVSGTEDDVTKRVELLWGPIDLKP